MSDVPPVSPSIHHIAVASGDLDASLRFYREGLGLEEVTRAPLGERTLVFLRLGDSYIELQSPVTASPVHNPPLMHLAVRTPDTDAAVARALAAGGTLQLEPRDLDLQTTQGPRTVRIAFVAGPDGESIEFVQSDTL